MPTKNNERFQFLEKVMTGAVAGDGILFVLYLIAAGTGVIWLKVTAAILVFVVSALALTSLYLTGEIRRIRSRWLVAAFAAFLICLVFSLVLNYPSPSPKPIIKEGLCAIVNQL